jgi:hypothetical protein
MKTGAIERRQPTGHELHTLEDSDVDVHTVAAPDGIAAAATAS